ncbi:MAG TPA: hypothetical protein VGC30_10485 [Dokdonella sp.]
MRTKTAVSLALAVRAGAGARVDLSPIGGLEHALTKEICSRAPDRAKSWL